MSPIGSSRTSTSFCSPTTASFGAFDSGLHALAFTGGPIAEGFVMLLAEESPTRVARAHGVYRGELSADARDAWFAQSLATRAGAARDCRSGEVDQKAHGQSVHRK